jgi:integrase
VLAVYEALPTRYQLPLVVLDATGMRLGELERLCWGDVDEQDGRWRVTSAASKTKRARWGTCRQSCSTRCVR